MFAIINLPTGNQVSAHTLLADAERALFVIETAPPTHEIVGEPEPEVAPIE
jgi:hypothetical protein